MGSKEALKIAGLAKISKPVDAELDIFQSIFQKSMNSNVRLVDLITRFILKLKGKRIRPLLVLLSAKLCGGVQDRTYRGAVLVELLHTATLVHDDVVDEADKRRGFPSINAIWKNKIAVLMGDYLLSRGLLIAMQGKDYDFLEKITETVNRMSQGELLQIQKTRKLDIDEKTYFKVISDKTASLIETCCIIGAMSSTDDISKIEAMLNYGTYLGISFQIRDDILDLDKSAKLFGKPVGGDIKEKKITLPLIYALSGSTSEEAKRIKKLLKNIKKNNSVDEIIDFINSKNGVQLAEAKALEFAKLAKQTLEVFPESEERQSLTTLIDFVVNRRN